jgi:hypothetical protein
MRYTILAFIITLQGISFRVKKRFPSLQHLVDAGELLDKIHSFYLYVLVGRGNNTANASY